MNRKSVIGIYGNINIPRGWCDECKTYAFIQDGCLSCCEHPFEAKEIKDLLRMSDGGGRRRRPGKKERDRLLEKFGGRCAYCDGAFGSIAIYHGRVVFLNLEWDHIVPWVYDQDERDINLLPVCQICNGWKGSLMFRTIEEARVYVNNKWIEEGRD